MTERPLADELSLSPARRGRHTPLAEVIDGMDADLARGQASAVLGGLGRLQLRLEVMAREQAEALAQLQQQLAELTRRLDGGPALAPVELLEQRSPPMGL